MGKGNQPTDGGHLLLNAHEKDELLRHEPEVAPYIKKFLGGQEFIQGIERYCLWLVNIDPGLLRRMPKVIERLEGVKKMRIISTDPKTREMAKTPWLFRETCNYDSYVAIPEISSGRRPYIPIGFLIKRQFPVINYRYFLMEHFGILVFLLQSCI